MIFSENLLPQISQEMASLLYEFSHDYKCVFSYIFSRQISSHKSHREMASLQYQLYHVVKYVFSSFLFQKIFSHKSYQKMTSLLYEFSHDLSTWMGQIFCPICTKMCLFIYLFAANLLPQISQGNGFSPV